MPTRTEVNLDAVQTLTNKTLTAPTITAPTIVNGTLDAATAVADPLVALGLATKQYVDQAGIQPTSVNYTTTGTIGAGVGLALLSGATFTLTLLPAASWANRSITILHRGSSLTQVYTIKGNGSENIVGHDQIGNTFLLYTTGEELEVHSDGTTIQVIRHHAQTAWVDAGVMTITGTTSNPTKPTVVDYDHVFWRRDGKTAHVKWIFQISNGAGAADGSGNYLFATPTGIAIDSILPPVGTAYATAVMSEALRSGVFGLGQVVIDSSAKDNVLPFAFDTTHLQWARDSNATAISSSAYEMTNDEFGYYLEAHFPAANWRV